MAVNAGRGCRRAGAAAVALVAAVAAGCGGDDDAIRWLALGDSYSSGEGTDDATGSCGRSPGAYPYVAGADLDGAEVVHLACSGAETVHVVDQLGEALASDEAFDVVTFTAGGNDAGYAQVLTDCMGLDDVLERVGDVLDRFGDDDEPENGEAPDEEAAATLLRGCDVTEDELGVRVDEVEDRVAEIVGEALEHVDDDGRVVVVGYPHLFEAPETWGTGEGVRCDGVADDDVRTLRRVAERLDGALRDAVSGLPRAEYLSLLEPFAGHGRCSEDPWVNGVVLRPRVTGSFHPNDAGHRAVADALVELLED